MSNNLNFTITASTKEAQRSLAELARAFQSLKASSGATASLGAGASSALPGIAALTAALGTAAAAAASVGIAFKKGLNFNSEAENVRLGITGIVSSLFDVRDAAGEAAKGQESLAIAGQEADKQLALLRIAGAQTSAEFKDLAKAFQTALGAGAGAGLNVDQIRKLTVDLTLAASAFNLSGDQLSSEIRAVLSGDEVDNSQIAKGLGLTGEQIKQLREQGTLFDELNKRLEQYRLLGEEAGKTLTATLSNVNDGVGLFLGKATKGAFEELKTSLQTALGQVIDTTNGGVQPAFQGLLGLTTEISDSIGNGITSAISGAVSLAQDLSQFFSDNREQVLGLFDGISAVTNAVGQLIGVFAGFLTALTGSVVKSGGLKDILVIVGSVIAGLADGFNVVLGAVGTLGSGIVIAVLEPLKSVAALIDRITGANFEDIVSKAQAAAVAFGKVAAQKAVDGVNRTVTKAFDEQVAANQRARFAAEDPRRLDRGTATPAAPIGTVGTGRRTVSDQSRRAAKQAADELTKSLDALAKAEEEADKTRFAARQERLRAELDREVALGLKTKKEEIDARLKLELAGLTREREAAEAELQRKRARAAAETDAAKRNGLLAEVKKAEAALTALEDKERTIVLKAEVDIEAAKKAARQLAEDLQLSIDELSGSQTVNVDRINLQRQRMLQDDRVRGNPELEGLVNRQADLQVDRARFDDAKNALAGAEQDLQNAEKRIQNLYEQGAINSLEREKQLADARLAAIPILEAQLKLLQEQAAASGDVNLKREAEGASIALEQLRISSRAVSNESAAFLKDQFSEAFRAIIDGTKSVGDALRDVLINSLQRQANRFLDAFLDDAVASLSKLASSAGGGAGAGYAGLIQAGLSLFGFAEGGSVKGPGTGTSDSILARLSNGEFVVKAASVRALGTDTLRYINQHGRLPMFNAGGLVESAGGFGGGPTTVDNQISVAPSVTVTTGQLIDGFQKDPAFERFIVQLAINNRKRINGS